ncbi:hypothetical protein IR148_16175 [Dysgonomonas mossii]|uniref:Uncharacterized protein n=1 Tax=Dysgonomonas mossii TaxID=163665 RepID=A0A4Y9IIA1_9BACT|nr:hypothetical protein [Dysgonomonas mossii]MBF0762577.1 hypothetical protein [Dysgonomonas mossii]TFU86980.1 hypothetical protein E4T88_16150 [Dysgonomonas mossii]
MDQTVLSGLFALGGAIIGGLVTIGATVISNKKQVKLELKKQRIEFLNSKKNAMEKYATELPSFTLSMDNPDKMIKLYHLFYQIEHYLNDEPDFEKIKDSFDKVLFKITDSNLIDEKDRLQLTFVGTSIQALLRNKLCIIMKALEKEMSI